MKKNNNNDKQSAFGLDIQDAFHNKKLSKDMRDFIAGFVDAGELPLAKAWDEFTSKSEYVLANEPVMHLLWGSVLQENLLTGELELVFYTDDPEKKHWILSIADEIVKEFFIYSAQVIGHVEVLPEADFDIPDLSVPFYPNQSN